MDEARKSRSIIPRKAQVPLVVIGIAGLLYVAWNTANTMGWIGKPPRAKAPVTAKQPSHPSGETAATQPSSASTAAAPPVVRRPTGPAKNLDSIRPPARDPMTDLRATATAPTPATPTGPLATPPAPPATPPPAAASTGPPLLPPPMPGGAQPGFPSPVTGPGAVPPAVPAGPRPPVSPPHALPAALTSGYPLARRGTHEQAAEPQVTLVGTISGNRGSMAVVHPGDSARGQYVKPGQTVAGGTTRVESIEAGRIKVSGQGGAHELSLRPPPSAAQPKPEAAAPGGLKPPRVKGASQTGPTPD
jgi:hypothetical protein